MKTLKRTLSLVLVIAMVLSFGLVSASISGSAVAADFTDADSITQDEAVAVMSGLGVIDGITDGAGVKFDPTGSFTREMAAKIIAYMKLGSSAADAYKGSTDPFKDVKANRWSAGYIAYCAAQGIIAGDGTGNFNPEGKLTNYAWLKMLLVALGYNADLEGLANNKDWEINTATLALGDGGIVSADDLALSFDREAAVLYAFNTLKADMVEYKSKSTSISIGGATITTGGGDYSKIARATEVGGVGGGNYAYDAAASLTIAGIGTQQFCEKYFPNLRLKVDSTDELGRSSNRWYNGSTNKDYATAANETAALTLTASTGGNTTAGLNSLNSKLRAAGMAANLTAVGTLPVYVNDFAGTGYNAAMTVATLLGNLGNGYTAEFYLNSAGAISCVVLVQPTLVKVTAVKATAAKSTEGAYTTYTAGGANGKVYTSHVDEIAEVDTAKLATELKKGDIVLGYKDQNGVLQLSAPVKTVEGTLTNKTSAGVYTIDGTKYNASAISIGTAAKAAAISTKSNTFYLDTEGNVIGQLDPGVAATQYLLAIDAYTGTVTKSNGKNANVDYATVVDVEGTVSDIVVAAAVTPGNLYTVASVSTDDVYTLTNITTTATTTSVYAKLATITAKSTALAAKDNAGANNTAVKYADGSTKFIFVNYDSSNAPDGTVNIVTGASNVSGYTGLTKTFAIDTDTTADTVANVVFVYDNATAQSSGNYVYVTGEYSDGASRTWDTISKGVAGTLVTSTGINPADGTNPFVPGGGKYLDTGLYSSLVYDGTNVSGTKATPSNDGTTDYTGIKVSGGILYVTITAAGDPTWTIFTAKPASTDITSIESTVPVYTIHTDSLTGEATTAGELDADGLYGASAVYIEYNSAQTAIAAIYVEIAD